MKTKAFNIDIERLVILLLPMCLRKPGIVALLTAIVTPLQWLYTQFLGKRDDHLFIVTKTGQVAVLLSMLNNYKWKNPLSSEFQIEDMEAASYHYAYSEESEKYPLTLMARSEGSGVVPVRVWSERRVNEENFPYRLIVPQSVWDNPDDLDKVKRLMQTYRLPGRICDYTRSNIIANG